MFNQDANTSMRMLSRKASANITSSVVVLALDTLALIPRVECASAMSLRDAAAPSNKSNESVMNVVQSNFKKVAGEGADAVEVQQSVSLRGEGGRLLFWRPLGLT